MPPLTITSGLDVNQVKLLLADSGLPFEYLGEAQMDYFLAL